VRESCQRRQNRSTIERSDSAARLFDSISRSIAFLAFQHISRGRSWLPGHRLARTSKKRKGCQSRRDIAAKFSIALKEARETVYWLRLLCATELIDRPTIAPLLREANELVSILTVAQRRLTATNEPGKPRPRLTRTE
jgi:hypothetical protein